MGAWIETEISQRRKMPCFVASYMGAWIETVKDDFSAVSYKSHPTWVRGLKHEIFNSEVHVLTVASYMGAWIETITPLREFLQVPVASYMGAWIETVCPEL